MPRIDDRISVRPPDTPARRERLEREVFQRLDQLRAGGDPDPAPRPRAERAGRRAVFALAACGLAAAAGVTVWLLARRDPTSGAAGPARSLIVTPPGGASRVALGDAIIDARSDTAVAVDRAPDGGIVLDLRRGAIDCDVTPRPGRPSFVVRAGEVVVTVTGTRFSVSRDEAVRVDVSRGSVQVSAGGRTDVVTAGETWSSNASRGTTADLQIPDGEKPPIAPDEGSAVVAPPSKSPPPVNPKQAFAEARRLERGDPGAAGRAYRTLARGKDSWAALALYSLADLEARRGGAEAALAAIDEYEDRFQRGANAEDAAWLRVEIHREAGRAADARAAARRYLDRFPDGTYARPAATLLDGTRSP